MREIGITTSYGFKMTSENLRDLKEGGLSAIEVSLNNDVNFKEVYNLAKPYDIKLWSCHLPFKPVDELDISIEDPALRKLMIDYHSEKIRQGSDVGIKRFVLHPSTPVPEERRQERKKCAMDTLSKLAPVAKECGAVICVEDMTLPCLGNSADELLEIISVDDSLRICFDVNHLFNDTHEEFARKVKGKVATVHISDYNFIQEGHVFPGKGKINWPEVYKNICDTGYEGVWMYELGREATKATGEKIQFSFRDFYNVSVGIFNGIQPPIPY